MSSAVDELAFFDPLGHLLDALGELPAELWDEETFGGPLAGQQRHVGSTRPISGSSRLCCEIMPQTLTLPNCAKLANTASSVRTHLDRAKRTLQFYGCVGRGSQRGSPCGMTAPPHNVKGGDEC